MHVPESSSEIERAARVQIARALEQLKNDRDDPRLPAHSMAREISNAIDDLTGALNELDTLIKLDSSETHP